MRPDDVQRPAFSLRRQMQAPGDALQQTLENLKAGDYLINDKILVERKAKEDFRRGAYTLQTDHECATSTGYHSSMGHP